MYIILNESNKKIFSARTDGIKQRERFQILRMFRKKSGEGSSPYLRSGRPADKTEKKLQNKSGGMVRVLLSGVSCINAPG